MGYREFLQRTRQGLALVAATALLAACGMPGLPPTAQRQSTATAGVREAGGKAFPPRFMWGVATAGHQYEGGDTSSNWTAWEKAGRVPQPIQNAVDDYHLYAEHLDLAKAMGMTSYRMSIEWSRIEPQPGQIDAAAVQHYHDVLSAVRARGMEPVVTLIHFSYPAWLDQPDAQGRTGWESPRMVTESARFAGWAAKEYGSQIKWWLTINEPNTDASCSYVAGLFPPGKHNPIAYVQVMKAMIEAHKAMYLAIHQVTPTAQVSINPIMIHPRPNKPVYKTQSLQLFLNETDFLDALAPHIGKGAPGTTANYLDYVAFNYFYAVNALDFVDIANYLKWPIYPEGMYQVSKMLYARYQKPLMVTENGLATDGDHPRPDGWTRPAFLVNHLAQLKRAMDEGVPVVGYMHWSLMDNYEWGSYAPQFGLYGVDRRNPSLKPFATATVGVYGSIAKSNSLPQSLLDRYFGFKN